MFRETGFYEMSKVKSGHFSQKTTSTIRGFTREIIF